MFDDQDVETLAKLGLNSTQAKIYLTLLVLGASSVKKISQIAQIDRGEVYRQIAILQKNALIEKIIDIPNRYNPISLNEAIKILIKLKNKENAEITHNAKMLLEKGVNTEQPIEEDSKISIIREDISKQHLPNRYKNLKKEEVWYTQIENIPFALNLWDKDFKKAFARGIKLRTIAELNEPTKALLKLVHNYSKENPNFIIRFVNPTLLTTFAVYDDKELTFYTEKKKGLNKRPILWTTNSVLIEIFKDYFELRWKNAMTQYQSDNLS